MRTLVVLDFDGCVTCADDTLTLSRAEKLASMIDKFSDLKTRFIILTMANTAHVFDTVRRSRSARLLKIFESIDIISIDDRRFLNRMDKTRGETPGEKNRMISEIMTRNDHTSFRVNDDELVYAYKKSRSLMNLARLYSVENDNIYFLDDNLFNIKFAVENGFRAFLVHNKKRPTKTNTLYLLEKIEQWMRVRLENIEMVENMFTIWKRAV